MIAYRDCLIGILLLLAGCAAPGQPPLSTGVPSAGFARTALSDGAPEVALNVATANLKSHPGDTDAMLIQGDALSQLGRTAEAEAAYRGVLARDPASPAACRGLGRLLLATDPAGAEALFQRDVTQQPRDAAALNDLGIARDLQGRHAEAQAAYRAALAAAPDLSAATANLALSLSLTGHAAEGVQMLRPLADAAGATPRLRYDLAAVATMAGDREEAAQVLKNDLSTPQIEDALNGFAALSPPAPQ
jgi:Flp pilus assembly protein TadD